MTRERTRAEAAERAAVAFFYKHAGYSYTPGKESPRAGRLRGARALAAAERDAHAAGFSVAWAYDDDPCIGCECGSKDCPCSTGEDHETMIAWVEAPDGTRQANGRILPALCGICEPSREYRRVVAAELFAEMQ